jgi:hypothetical protein
VRLKIAAVHKCNIRRAHKPCQGLNGAMQQ